MAVVKDIPYFLVRVKKSLVENLGRKGIKARVHVEPVPQTKLYRVAVFSPQFKEMAHSERQSLVWRIAEKEISDDEQMSISMILTLTPDEAKGK